MPKKITDIAPPTRAEKAPVPATSQRKAAELVQLNVRIPADRARYLRMLAADSGRPMQELVTEAVDLLEKKAGRI